MSTFHIYSPTTDVTVMVQGEAPTYQSLISKALDKIMDAVEQEFDVYDALPTQQSMTASLFTWDGTTTHRLRMKHRPFWDKNRR